MPEDASQSEHPQEDPEDTAGADTAPLSASAVWAWLKTSANYYWNVAREEVANTVPMLRKSALAGLLLAIMVGLADRGRIRPALVVLVCVMLIPLLAKIAFRVVRFTAGEAKRIARFKPTTKTKTKTATSQ